MRFHFTSKKHRPILNNSVGMTLVEILIVITIIGSVMAILITRVVGAKDKANIKNAKIQLGQVVNSLNMFYTDCGRYPASLQSLIQAPGQDECPEWGPDPYLKENLLKDPWRHDFVYESDGNNFTLKSLGRDGKEGGTGYDKDITADEL